MCLDLIILALAGSFDLLKVTPNLFHFLRLLAQQLLLLDVHLVTQLQLKQYKTEH